MSASESLPVAAVLHRVPVPLDGAAVAGEGVEWGLLGVEPWSPFRKWTPFGLGPVEAAIEREFCREW